MTKSSALDLDALVAVYNDPVLFVDKFLGATPEPWQVVFLNNVARHNRIAVRSGHGIGKTTALAWVCLWAILTRFPVAVVVTAPSAAQIESGLWAALRTWHRRLPPEFGSLITLTSEKAELNSAQGESFIIARTSSKERPEALQGVHAENTFLIIDEASGVDEIVFETAIGSLSTKGAKIIMTSNPTRTSGYFFDAFHRTSHLWTLQKVSSFESRYSSSGEHIAEWEAKKATQPNAYRVRVLGEFPDSENDVLINRSFVEEAIARTKDEVEVRLEDGNSILKPNDGFVAATGGPIIWGLDVARFGDDSCALAKRQGNTLLEPIKAWGNIDLMFTVGKVVDEWNRTIEYERPSEIYVDVIGMGGGVVDRLRELNLPARGVNVSNRPHEPERFMRLRDELWYRSKEWFENGTARIPDQPELVAELCTPGFRIESSGKIKVEGKEEMKRRGYRSPNMADAFNLTMMNLNTSTKAFGAPIKYEVHDSYFV